MQFKTINMSTKSSRPKRNTLPSQQANDDVEESAISLGRETVSDDYAGAEMLDAKTAALLLGVKTQTLYAYVSRGLIRATPKRGTQAHLYHREDIETLKMNGRGSGAPPVDSSERLVRWGASTALQTAVTSIDAGGPRYRGKCALDLASMGIPFENCVELLWNGVLPVQPVTWLTAHRPQTFLAFCDAASKVARHSNSRQLLAMITDAYSVCIGRNPETALGAPVLAARQLIQMLAPCVGLLHGSTRYVPSGKPQSVATIIAENANLAQTDDVLGALNSCLILCADHEMAPSTFAARMVASAGADIFSCVSSALGTFDGPLTGFGCDESERLLLAAKSPKGYVDILKGQVRRKEALLGYNHPLYPSGDPRAAFLLDLARSISAQDNPARHILSCVDAAAEEVGASPSLPIGLVAISAAIGLPVESPGMLLAIGRVSGWVAHVFEQRLAGSLIRPRTRYIGPTD